MKPTFDLKPRSRAFAVTLLATLIVGAYSPPAVAQGSRWTQGGFPSQVGSHRRVPAG